MASEVIESVDPVRGWCDGSGVWSEVEENVSRGSWFGVVDGSAEVVRDEFGK